MLASIFSKLSRGTTIYDLWILSYLSRFTLTNISFNFSNLQIGQIRFWHCFPMTCVTSKIQPRDIGHISSYRDMWIANVCLWHYTRLISFFTLYAFPQVHYLLAWTFVYVIYWLRSSFSRIRRRYIRAQFKPVRKDLLAIYIVLQQ